MGATEVTSLAPSTSPTPAPTTTTTTPAPPSIIKQINEINEDGTCTVGFEAADGTFKLETRDEEGNVEGKYGFLDESGELKIVSYSSNNSTGFTSDLAGPIGPSGVPLAQSPEFELEQKRHAAVIAHQAAVVERQRSIAAQRDDQARRRAFANQRSGPRRQVFNAARFNPQAPLDKQFNTQNFDLDFQQFQQQQQQPQQFAPQQQQQFAPQQQFSQQQFAPQQQQQFAPQQQQQFAPQQQQQFAPQQ